MTPSAEALSARKVDVLKGLGSGLSISEVARSMNLSVKTVSTYRARMIEKLIGIQIERGTTAALIRYAIKSGLVD